MAVAAASTVECATTSNLASDPFYPLSLASIRCLSSQAAPNILYCSSGGTVGRVQPRAAGCLAALFGTSLHLHALTHCLHSVLPSLPTCAGKFVARICVPDGCKTIASFDNDVDAAHAYDRAVLQRGQVEKLNFLPEAANLPPHDPPVPAALPAAPFLATGASSRGSIYT